MSDKWRSKADSEYEDFNDEYEVKPPQPHDCRKEEPAASSSSRHSDEHEGRHKHHHKSKSHKKHKRKSSRKRKHASRSRSRSRSREKNEYKREKHDRERPFRSPDEKRTESTHPSRSARFTSRPVERFPDRDRGKVPETYATERDKSIPEQNSTQPPSGLANVSSEAARLKEEIERRKLLWSKKDKPAPTSVPAAWQSTAFSHDADGKVSAKFKRLMGMKDGDSSGSQSSSKNSSQESDVAKQTQEYLANLEKQYEVARATTHTQRGLGLGFSSGRLYPR